MAVPSIMTGNFSNHHILVPFLFLFALLLSHESAAQKLIRLSQHTKGNFFIRQGERVKCKLIDGTKLIGILGKLTDTTFEINGKRIQIEKIKAFAKKKKGSNLFIGLVIGAGIALVLTGTIHSKEELYLIGTVQTLLIIKPIYNRKWRDVKTNWELEIIDQ